MEWAVLIVIHLACPLVLGRLPLPAIILSPTMPGTTTQWTILLVIHLARPQVLGPLELGLLIKKSRN